MNLKDLSLSELEQWCAERGHARYRARQLWRWLYQAQERVPARMTNLPERLRQQLEDETYVDAVWVDKVFTDRNTASLKAVLRLCDGVGIEAAALLYRFGYTACLSSQAGCRMACVFCASGQSWERNLSSGEIVDQVLRLADVAERPMSRVVLMGVGEPLDNYAQVVKALRQLHQPQGVNMGYRHMTVSTCGLVPQMHWLADEGMAVNLAISLHAVDDEVRKALLPVAARRHSLVEIAEAARNYSERTGRQITFEYALIDRINDSDESAQRLAEYTRAVKGHVNLIGLNPVEGCELMATPRAGQGRFLQKLRREGISATMRRSLGVSINAACGQLRRG